MGGFSPGTHYPLLASPNRLVYLANRKTATERTESQPPPLLVPLLSEQVRLREADLKTQRIEDKATSHK